MPVTAFAAAATDAELEIFESYEVSSVNPELIKVNLFDYWVEGNQNTPDNVGYDTIAQNINNNFGAYVGINYDADNNRPEPASCSKILVRTTIP